MDVSANVSQFVESHVAEVVQHNSRRFQNKIMASGQTFPNADAFRDAMYLMSIAGRFRYYYKKSNCKHMTVIYKVNDCPLEDNLLCCGCFASCTSAHVRK